MVYVITFRYITIRLQQLERFSFEIQSAAGCREGVSNTSSTGGNRFPAEEAPPPLWRPSCLSAKVALGAGVFLVVLRGDSPIYELRSAKTIIQSHDRRSGERGRVTESLFSEIHFDFHAQKKMANSTDLADP